VIAWARANAEPRGVLNLSRVRIDPPRAANGPWRASAVATNDGDASLFGCRVHYQDVDSRAFPLRYFALAPHEPWSLDPGEVHRSQDEIGWRSEWFPGRPRTLYIEVWADCTTPKHASVRHFFLLDFDEDRAFFVRPGGPFRSVAGVPVGERCPPAPFRQKSCDMDPLDLAGGDVVQTGAP
jgi:hypothetical protein